MPDAAPHDLFLLFVALSRLKNPEAVIRLFCQAMGRAWEGRDFRHAPLPEGPESENIPVIPGKPRFGYVRIQGGLGFADPVERDLIQNAVALLGVLLEKIEQERLLAERGEALEEEILIRTAELEQENRDRQAAEAELKKVFELSVDLLCVADVASSSFLKVNPAACSMLGYDSDEMVGKPFADFIHPDDLEATARVVEQELREGRQVMRFVNRYRTKGGDYRTLDWTARPVAEEGRIYAVARDVTESRAREAALLESERNYRLLFDSMIEGVAVHELVRDPAGRAADYRLLAVNPRFVEILGLPAAKAVGALGSELYGGGEAPYLELYAEVAESGRPNAFDTYFPPLDKYFRISVFSPKKDGFATVFEDVTERKRAGDELLKLRKYLSNIIDSMPSVLVGVDDHGLVTQWNREAVRVSGLDPSQALGRPLPEVFPELGGEMQRVREAMRTRSIQTNLKRLRQDGGEAHVEDVVIYPLVANGVHGAVIRVDDVTERARIENMMVQTEKMLSVGGLAAGMAHEINNPLGIVLASVQNCQRRIDPAFPKNREVAESLGLDLALLESYLEQRGVPAFLQSVAAAAERAARIVRNMLDFSRRSESQFAPCFLHQLLDKAIELAGSDYDLKKRYDFRAIEIVRDYEADLPPVRAAETEIEQVILNLLRNAAQAMAAGTGGQRPRIVARARRDGNRVRAEIADNGPGMDEAVRQRVFEPFFTTKEPGVGTGLGLSVSYFIVTQNHGGSIEVESSPGQGATFSLSLPAIAVPDAPPPYDA